MLRTLGSLEQKDRQPHDRDLYHKGGEEYVCGRVVSYQVDVNEDHG